MAHISMTAAVTGPSPGSASAQLLGQGDHQALGPADVAEPVAALVLHDLADELGAVAAQAGEHGVEVVDGEHDPTDAERVHGRVRSLALDGRRPVELVQLDAMAIGGP